MPRSAREIIDDGDMLALHLRGFLVGAHHPRMSHFTLAVYHTLVSVGSAG